MISVGYVIVNSHCVHSEYSPALVWSIPTDQNLSEVNILTVVFFFVFFWGGGVVGQDKAMSTFSAAYYLPLTKQPTNRQDV